MRQQYSLKQVYDIAAKSPYPMYSIMYEAFDNLKREEMNDYAQSQQGQERQSWTAEQYKQMRKEQSIKEESTNFKLSQLCHDLSTSEHIKNNNLLSPQRISQRENLKFEEQKIQSRHEYQNSIENSSLDNSYVLKSKNAVSPFRNAFAQ